MRCWSGASAVVAHFEAPGTHRTMEPNDSPRVGDALQGQRIAVVGLGYVGLPTALSFADEGAEVIGVDVSEVRLAAIKDLRAELLPRDRSRLIRALQTPLLQLTTEQSAVAAAGGGAGAIDLAGRRVPHTRARNSGVFASAGVTVAMPYSAAVAAILRCTSRCVCRPATHGGDATTALAIASASSTLFCTPRAICKGTTASAARRK